MVNKETIQLSLKLFIITALSALILAFVNKITAPVIAQNSIESFNKAQTEVLPEAVTFTKADFSDVELNVEGAKIDSLSIGLGGGNDCVGYAVTAVCAEGYGGDIKVMVGLSPELKILKVKILSASETPGLGAKASEPKFIDQYKEKSGELSVVKGGASNENEISAISGATITSKAVTKAVNAATSVLQKKIENGFNAKEISETNEIKDKIIEETEKQISENPDTITNNSENSGEGN